MIANPIPYANESEWHALRAMDVTASEVAALFGVSPYCTAFELAQYKLKRLPRENVTGERVFWGSTLEAAIAEGVSKLHGVHVRKWAGYARHGDPAYRLGATPDFVIDSCPAEADSLLARHFKEYGPGLIEVKNLDMLQHKRTWASGDDEEAAAHVEIQLQAQLEVTRVKWGVIAALVGGNQLRLIPRMRDPAVGAAICKAVVKFWTDLNRGILPPITLPDDAEIIVQLNQYAEPGTYLDAREREDLNALCSAYSEASMRCKAADDDKRSAQARILEALGKHEKATTAQFKISAGLVGPAEIPAYTRAGYRLLRVTKLKQKDTGNE